VLALDLLQEGVAWFADHGATPTRVPLRVAAPRRLRRRAPAARPGAAAAPVMEMHAVPEAEVRGWVQQAGGRVVAVGEILTAGREYLLRDWESALYVATRGGRADAR
jgi:hypothetical protein